MTDKELLELAAKAAGITAPVTEHADGALWVYTLDKYSPWNPLTDDGDALRLAVKLGLRVGTDGQSTYECIQCWKPHYASPNVFEPVQSDPYAAPRRAIVRAAAEIGRNMK
jgi:hypothetical protein